MRLLFIILFQAVLFQLVLGQQYTDVPTTELPLEPTTEVPLEPTTEVPLEPTTEVPLEPTTAAPTPSMPTLPPTTQPVTQPPATLPPTTQLPTTQPPTLPPTTQPPTTLPPTTAAPTTQAPPTLPPTTAAPTTIAPTTIAPTTIAPTTPTPIPTCSATPLFPESPVNSTMSASCEDEEIGDKTYTCQLVDSQPEWTLTDSTCTSPKPSIGTVVISFRIRFFDIVLLPYRSIILIIRTIVSIHLRIDKQFVIVSRWTDLVRRLDDSEEYEVRIVADVDDTKLIRKASSLDISSLLSTGMSVEPSVFTPSSSALFTASPRAVKDTFTCEPGFMMIMFRKNQDGVKCQVRVSDAENKKKGLILIDKLSVSAGYCLNPGYYYIRCKDATTVNVTNMYKKTTTSLDLTLNPHDTVIKLEDEEAEHTTVPGSSKKEFCKNKPLTGKPAYPKDPTDKNSDFTCDKKGYKDYLKKWGDRKVVSDDEFEKRLEYFKRSCKIIHKRRGMRKYPLEFTFYADWAQEEFEDIATSVVEYKGVRPPTEEIPIYNNTNYRYLMPSMDPCDENEELRETISKPQNCSVSWAFAITNSIEYAIKKMYFEDYDQIVEVSLSAQELIDCVEETNYDPTLEIGGCSGYSLASGFEYANDYGIAYSEYYPGGHTNVQGECKRNDTSEEQRYFIAGYEKPITYNKLGLFELMTRGPVAVTMGLDTKMFQYYRSDRVKDFYFDSSANQPSVYGVVVEYSQFAVDGDPTSTPVRKPYFAVETRLRACDSFVFRLAILDTIENANVGGIAGLAIRPIVTELLPTPVPPTEPPTTQPPTLPPPVVNPPELMDLYPDEDKNTIQNITKGISYYYDDLVLTGLPNLKRIETGGSFFKYSPSVSLTCWSDGVD